MLKSHRKKILLGLIIIVLVGMAKYLSDICWEIECFADQIYVINFGELSEEEFDKKLYEMIADKYGCLGEMTSADKMEFYTYINDASKYHHNGYSPFYANIYYKTPPCELLEVNGEMYGCTHHMNLGWSVFQNKPYIKEWNIEISDIG